MPLLSHAATIPLEPVELLRRAALGALEVRPPRLLDGSNTRGPLLGALVQGTHPVDVGLVLLHLSGEHLESALRHLATFPLLLEVRNAGKPAALLSLELRELTNQPVSFSRPDALLLLQGHQEFLVACARATEQLLLEVADLLRLLRDALLDLGGVVPEPRQEVARRCQL
jgi:hypothetical protein